MRGFAARTIASLNIVGGLIVGASALSQPCPPLTDDVYRRTSPRLVEVIPAPGVTHLHNAVER
jgi:hypothetical protein